MGISTQENLQGAPWGKRPANPLISVIVPCYNEEEVILYTHERLTNVLGGAGLNYEIIYVDDGSSDLTALKLRDIQSGTDNIGVVRLSRNFGHQVAVTAGLDYAEGDAVVLIDADLQDPPELIPDMVNKWREGFDIVYGVRTTREGETAFKLWTAKAFYRFINLLSEVPLPLDAGDFRLIDRRAADALRLMRERHRMIRAMTSWVGFNQTALPYEREKRFAGVSKYPLRKMILLALDGVVSFSVVPLRMVTMVGMTLFFFSLIGIVYAFVSRLMTDIWVPGWTLLFISSLMLGGLQLVFLGIIGEYVGRIYGEAKQRPLFLVMEVLGPDRFRLREQTLHEKAHQS
ncbi:glycosyltransferase family 2 protein [Defluviimonas aestuarii]|uniref:glycosyltransferase family 2 protein n=1 Tax=Albidovulum aestuarii TaxID=1130726 RepID=UPI00249B17CF|nr:glycosyltransferase family 2 protein [Defluviimonas aestuarii]MDI3337226.1 glycosyltransferase family 2 protein [Defluviimonas aestuarii]